MIHAGEHAHPPGCNCGECMEWTQTDSLAERVESIRYQLETGTLTTEQRENLTRELAGVEAQLDKRS
jgi:hypothetical protein